MSFSNLVSSLTPEEKREIEKYIKYRRRVASQGYRPVIAPSKGRVTKMLSDLNSFKELIQETFSLDNFAAFEGEDPLFKAKIRGRITQQEMLNDRGQSWKSAEVAEYLNISVQAVSKQRIAGKILGVSLGSSGYRFPSWQFVGGKTLPGLSKVLAVLDENLVPDWDKLRFLITGDYRLGGKTPIEILSSGDSLDSLLLAASAYGVHSAA
jgi:hypothetical protein